MLAYFSLGLSFLLSYKYFLLVVTHYILDCSTKQNLCARCLASLAALSLQTCKPLHKVAYSLPKTSFTPQLLQILSPFIVALLREGGGGVVGGW